MKSQYKWIVGIDEVGRGPVAGPVVLCGAMYPYKKYNNDIWKGVRDSKKMTAKNREQQVKSLSDDKNLKYFIASKSAKMIDKNGISLCIKECISDILNNLVIEPKDVLILLDGRLYAPSEYINQKTIIKGDDSEKIISIASVLAKVYRDKYMDNQHKKYPNYIWNQNKGYGTKLHIEAILKNGLSPLHRKTFLNKLDQN